MSSVVKYIRQNNIARLLAPNQPDFRILIAEDQPESRLLLHQLLESVGFTIRAVTNGYEAVELYKEWKPDLIWMDMRMPELDGYEATRQIRQIAQYDFLIIIAFTASAFEEERERMLASGCNDIVVKPLRETEIFSKLVDYLRVQYLYEDTSAIKELHALSTTLTPNSFSSFSSEWVISLQQASLRGDSTKANKLIDQIRVEHPIIAQTLGEMIYNYQFEKSLGLINKAS